MPAPQICHDPAELSTVAVTTPPTIIVRVPVLFVPEPLNHVSVPDAASDTDADPLLMNVSTQFTAGSASSVKVCEPAPVKTIALPQSVDSVLSVVDIERIGSDVPPAAGQFVPFARQTFTFPI